jgi:hypothetical protein
VVVVGQRSILVGLDGERLDVMEKGLRAKLNLEPPIYSFGWV